MKKTILFELCILFSLTSSAQLRVQKEKLVEKKGVLYIQENGTEYRVNTKTITVKLKEGKTLDCKGGSVVRQNKLGYIDIDVPEGYDVQEYATMLDEGGDYEVVELNTYYKCNSVYINDTDAPSQWHLNRINAYAAWDFTMGNPNIKVAVIDNGVDAGHSDIGMGSDGYKNVDSTLGWDYVANCSYTTPTHAHGTFVAGIIGAKTNNYTGIAGISGGNNQSGITIIPYRLGSGLDLDDSKIDDAILDAVDKGAMVINMSFGGPHSTAINNALEYAYSQGVCLVAATGNGGASTIDFPAFNSKVIAVGATDQYNLRSSFSNYGTGLDLVAPGSAVYSTILNGGYDFNNGTSFSAPQVTGVITLMLSINPDLTPEEIRTKLINSAYKIPNYTFNSNGWNNEVGYGMLNAYAAITALFEIDGPELICDSAYYEITNLPAGFTVSWDISNQFYKDAGLFQTSHPDNNQCTITRSSSTTLNDTLRATIYNQDNDSVYALKKHIRTRTPARFHLWYGNIYAQGNSSVESVNEPNAFYPTYVEEGVPVIVPSGQTISILDNRIKDMTITSIPADRVTYSGGNLLSFTSGGILNIYATSNVSCDSFTLEFYSSLFGNEPIMVSHEGQHLDISINDMEATTLSIYRASDGKRMYIQSIINGSSSVNTEGWKSGIYIIRIVSPTNIATRKINITH